MRKLKLQMQMTIDGFVGGPEGQLDWMEQAIDPKQLELLFDLTEKMDMIIMGRKMTEGFTTYWENVAENEPESPEHPYARIFVDTPKILFSKTTKSITGKNVIVENGDLVESVKKLKQQEGKDIVVYGGANFVSELIKNRLIDELNLFINPTTLGNGLKIFFERNKFTLINSTACKNGVIINQYQQNS